MAKRSKFADRQARREAAGGGTSFNYGANAARKAKARKSGGGGKKSNAWRSYVGK